LRYRQDALSEEDRQRAGDGEAHEPGDGDDRDQLPAGILEGGGGIRQASASAWPARAVTFLLM
jgi:hypothetical protein